jgi:hypothetical protein
MPFTMPTEYSKVIESGVRAGKPKSEFTIKVYIRNLNEIADATGVDTLEKILTRPYSVIKFIRSIPPEEDEDTLKFKARIRTYFSAIFMILPQDIKSRENLYYRVNQKYQDAPPSRFKTFSSFL